VRSVAACGHSSLSSPWTSKPHQANGFPAAGCQRLDINPWPRLCQRLADMPNSVAEEPLKHINSASIRAACISAAPQLPVKLVAVAVNVSLTHCNCSAPGRLSCHPQCCYRCYQSLRQQIKLAYHTTNVKPGHNNHRGFAARVYACSCACHPVCTRWHETTRACRQHSQDAATAKDKDALYYLHHGVLKFMCPSGTCRGV